MTDTVKIKRPMQCRRQENQGGRVKHDSQGNVLKVKTRAEDSQEEWESLLLERTVDMEQGSDH